MMLPNFIWFAVPAVNDVLREKSVTPFVDMIASVFQVVMIVALCIIINKYRQKPMKKVIPFALFAGIRNAWQKIQMKEATPHFNTGGKGD